MNRNFLRLSALLLALLTLLSACGRPSSLRPLTSALPTLTAPPDLQPTPMDDGQICVASDTPLLAGVGEDPFPSHPHQRPDAPPTRTLRLELTSYTLTYRETNIGRGIDGELDHYVGGEQGELSVWYRAGTREIVSLELSTDRDYANDGEAVLLVKAANLLETVCTLPLDEMERSYQYIPKVPAQHERLATVRYDKTRADGRSYCSVVVDFHSTEISVVITDRPEPPTEVLEKLCAASDRLADYLCYTRPDRTPQVTEVSDDPLPDVYFKDGGWVLETKRTLTYWVGRNPLTISMTFYLRAC